VHLSPAFATMLHLGITGAGAAAFAEKITPIIPSYVLLLFLGMTMASDSSTLALTIGATTIGSVLGALCWYGLGRSLGPDRVERAVGRFGRYVFLSPAVYRRLGDSYRKNHFWVTAIGQVIPTARIYLALPAGVLRLEAKAFFVATLLGTLAWNAPLIGLGYALRHGDYELATLGEIITGGIITVELVAAFVIYRRRTTRKPAC